MHRLGKHPVKVGEFADIVAALRETAPMLERLWPLRITMLTPEAAREVAATAWDVIAHIKVSTSQTQIVAGSKMLHHVLPDLIPPIDGRYTRSFFTGNAVMPPRQAAAFALWYPQLAEIGARCQRPITTPSKTVASWLQGKQRSSDNAIVSYTNSTDPPSVVLALRKQVTASEGGTPGAAASIWANLPSVPARLTFR